MKRVLLSLILLSLAACFPAPMTLVPVDTAVALTLAAEPKTNTPIPSATFTLTPTSLSNATLASTEVSLVCRVLNASPPALSGCAAW